MIKYITIALFLLTAATAHAQNPQADTSIALSVYNTGVSFKLIPADFGGVLTTPLVATMVMSYDTVMVLKENGKVDTTGRKPIRYKIERLCDKMSRDLKGKIVVMELNKDCDVTQTCLNVQRAGAKAFVIIHNSNSQGNIKLPKKGLYKDSIRIPIFTVRSGVGDSITTLLPTMVGIRKPTIPPVQSLSTKKDSTFDIFASKPQSNTEGVLTQGQGEQTGANALNEDALKANSFGIGKQAFSLSPNPTRDQTTLTYQFLKETDVTMEVKTASGQVILSKLLRGITVGSLEISTVDWSNGTYFISLQSGKAIKTKTFVVQH